MSFNPLGNCWTPSYYGPPAKLEAIRGLKGVKEVDNLTDGVHITTGTERQAKILSKVLEPKIDGQKVKLQGQRSSGEAAIQLKPAEVKAILSELTGASVTVEMSAKKTPKSYEINIRAEEVKWADGLIADKIGNLPVHIKGTPTFDARSESW